MICSLERGTERRGKVRDLTAEKAKGMVKKRGGGRGGKRRARGTGNPSRKASDSFESRWGGEGRFIDYLRGVKRKLGVESKCTGKDTNFNSQIQ